MEEEESTRYLIGKKRGRRGDNFQIGMHGLQMDPRKSENKTAAAAAAETTEEGMSRLHGRIILSNFYFSFLFFYAK